MRYKIASNSKQSLAAAMLLLAEEGKLSIDDPVSRFLPELTRRCHSGWTFRLARSLPGVNAIDLALSS